jgi:hypothetical protein
MYTIRHMKSAKYWVHWDVVARKKMIHLHINKQNHRQLLVKI